MRGLGSVVFRPAGRRAQRAVEAAKAAEFEEEERRRQEEEDDDADLARAVRVDAAGCNNLFSIYFYGQ